MPKWDAVLSAVFTALLVTLVIEYFAKPRLEARKERILQLVRTRHALGDAILQIGLASRVLVNELAADAPPDVVDAFNCEQERQYQRLRDKVLQLFDDSGTYVRIYVDPIRDDLMVLVMSLYRVILSPRTRKRQAQMVIVPVDAAMPIIDPVRRKRRLLRLPAARERLRRLAEEAESQAAN
jgi:hypothetical protein